MSGSGTYAARALRAMDRSRDKMHLAWCDYNDSTGARAKHAWNRYQKWEVEYEFQRDECLLWINALEASARRKRP